MKKSSVILLILIFFLFGILVDRAVLYYEIGEKNKELLKEQESLKEDYKILIQRFEMVEQELELRKINDSILVVDSTY